MRNGRKTGLTMIELLVVLAIVAVVLGIGVPTVASLVSPKHVLRKEARGAIKLFAAARDAAMSRRVQVDVRVDPAKREIRAVEAAAWQRLERLDPDGLMDEEERAAAMSNHFERVVTIDDGTQLEVFSAEQVDSGAEAEKDPFQRPADDTGFSAGADDDEEGSVVALSFNHFGGCTGGGVGLLRDGVRLDIACDILTGRPVLVTLRNDE